MFNKFMKSEYDIKYHELFEDYTHRNRYVQHIVKHLIKGGSFWMFS